VPTVVTPGPDGTYVFTFHTRETPEHAFDYIVDFKRHPEWQPTLTEVVGIWESPLSKKGSFRQVFGVKPSGWRGIFFNPEEVICTISDLERPGLISWTETRKDSEGGKSDRIMRFMIEAQPEGSRIELQCAFYSLPDWVGKLQSRLISPSRLSTLESRMEKATFGATKSLTDPVKAAMDRLNQRLDHFRGEFTGKP
jgi:hypothetical protein